jgi:hypothetical protein
MKITRLVWATLAIGSLLMSCSKDVVGNYRNGVFVVNEGNGQTTGTVGFFYRDNGQVENDIYSSKNGGGTLGAGIKSMYIFNNTSAYITSSVGNQITLVEPTSFVKTGLISIPSPRYVLPFNDGTQIQMFISQYTNGAKNNNLSHYNSSGNRIDTSFNIGNGAGFMQLVGGKVYILNDGSSRGSDSSITIFSALGDSLLTTIKTGALAANPNSLAYDSNNDLWVLCGGDPTISTTGKLLRFRGDYVDKTTNIEITLNSKNLITDNTAHYLYFIGGDKKIYKKDIINFGNNKPELFYPAANGSANFIPGLTVQTPNAIGFDPKTGYLWIADAKDKISNGTINVVDLVNQKVLYSFDSGVNPNGFVYY